MNVTMPDAVEPSGAHPDAIIERIGALEAMIRNRVLWPCETVESATASTRPSQSSWRAR